MGNAYQDAFSIFLKHTDQKVRAKEWLTKWAGQQAKRDLFVDAGAGTGSTTAWLTPYFKRTIAVEPNPSLFQELKAACPSAESLSTKILDTELPAAADLALCSHVLYYIDEKEWLPTASRILSWLAPTGTAVVLLQNPETDCMKMYREFYNHRFLIAPLAEDLKKANPNLKVSVERVESWIETRDAESAYRIAEFVLNLIPMEIIVPEQHVKNYVEKHFKVSEGHYRFSCHQDFMLLTRA